MMVIIKTTGVTATLANSSQMYRNANKMPKRIIIELEGGVAWKFVGDYWF
jgi:hypothetical protein